MRKDFGFKEILWVFSGRRGVHAWVADDRAFKLDTRGRNAIIGYLTPLTKMNHPFSAMFDHPLSLRDDDLISESFREILTDQKMLDVGSIQKTLHTAKETLFPFDGEHLLNINDLVSTHHTQKARWECIENILLNNDEDYLTNKASVPLQRNKTMRMRKDTQRTLMHIRFDNFYPKIDTNVSYSATHLLKVITAKKYIEEELDFHVFLVTGFYLSLACLTSFALATLIVMLTCTLHLLVFRDRPRSVFIQRPRPYVSHSSRKTLTPSNRIKCRPSMK